MNIHPKVIFGVIAVLGYVVPISGQICSGEFSQNIFPQGDFGRGVPNVFQEDPGLAPSYQYTTSPPPDDGQYTITNNTLFWGAFADPFWVKTGDRSNDPYGYMMVINAYESPGIFFSQSFSVCESTLYEFSVDVLNLFKPGLEGNLPNIDILVNGEVYYRSGNIPEDGMWKTHRFAYQTLIGMGDLTISLRNNATGGYGNDLALDNFSFRMCGPSIEIEDTLKVCPNQAFLLKPSITNSNFSSPNYQWQKREEAEQVWTNVPGANSPELEVDQAFTGEQYRLLIANTPENLNFVSCRVVSQPISIKSFSLPIIDTLSIINPTSCLEPDGQIEIFASESFQYSLDDGKTFQFTPFFGGLAHGNYELIIQNEEGCKTTRAIDLGAEKLPTIVEIDLKPTSCGQPNGSIKVDAFGISYPLTYSLDGINYQASPEFNNLSGGTFPVFVKDANSCLTEQEITVATSVELSLDSIRVDPTSCGQANGRIEGTFIGGNGESFFALNEEAYQASSIFENLKGGIYQLFVKDEQSCMDSMVIQVPESWPINGEDLELVPTSCGWDNGSIQIKDAGGTGNLSYNLNGGNYQARPFFDSLSAGNYLLSIQDEVGCTFQKEIEILGSTKPSIIDIEVVRPDCGETNGQLKLTIDGGSGSYRYQLAGQTLSELPVFENLRAGPYRLLVKDQNNCSDQMDILVTPAPCFYVPNAFSPNGDGINDRLEVFMNEIVSLESFKIFNRWGQPVFESNSDINFWDGRFAGQEAPSGTYIYWLVLRDNLGHQVVEKGEINLLR